MVASIISGAIIIVALGIIFFVPPVKTARDVVEEKYLDFPTFMW